MASMLLPVLYAPCAVTALLLQRKKTAVRTKIARDALMRLVEKAKTCTGDKAVRVLQKAVKAEIL